MKLLVTITFLISAVSIISGCTPGETWKESCHTCICEGGRPACTRELCPGEGVEMVLPPIREKRQAAECKPGTRWKEECNSCFCTPNGVKACTRMECFKMPNRRQ